MNCLYPDCPNTSRTRGLCHGHYQTMRARMRALDSVGQQMLEQSLEGRGLLTMKGTGGTPAPDSRDAFKIASTVKGKHHPNARR